MNMAKKAWEREREREIPSTKRSSQVWGTGVQGVGWGEGTRWYQGCW